MNEEHNKNIVAEFFKRFSNADAAGALELLDDSATWRAMGNEGGLPMSGVMDKEAIGALIKGVSEAIPGGLKLTPTGWTAEGDRVALEMESYGELSNGKVYNNFYHFLATLSDGKIVSLREYMDTHHAKSIFIDN